MHVNASKAQAAAEVLGLDDIYTLDTKRLHLVYRAEAKKHHPDVANSDAARWAAISHANIVLMAWLVQRATVLAAPLLGKGDCRACSGQGWIQRASASGFGKGIRMVCVLCAGTGNQKRNDRDE